MSSCPCFHDLLLMKMSLLYMVRTSALNFHTSNSIWNRLNCWTLDIVQVCSFFGITLIGICCVSNGHIFILCLQKCSHAHSCINLETSFILLFLLLHKVQTLLGFRQSLQYPLSVLVSKPGHHFAFSCRVSPNFSGLWQFLCL